YPVAGARYREFLTRFATSPKVPTARFELARTLLESPSPDYKAALEQLNLAAEHKDLPEYPQVLAAQGVAERGLGLKESAQAGGDAAARKHFTAADQHFTAAER